jgi:hypothetical protein
MTPSPRSRPGVERPYRVERFAVADVFERQQFGLRDRRRTVERHKPVEKRGAPGRCAASVARDI